MEVHIDQYSGLIEVSKMPSQIHIYFNDLGVVIR